MFLKETCLRNALQKSSYTTSEQYIMYTYIYGQNLVDTFGPLVSVFVLLIYKKPQGFAVNHPMNITTKFGSNWL